MIKLLSIFLFFSLLLTGCKNPLGDADPFSDTFCAGNTDPTIDEECNPISQDPNTSILSWDFLNSGDYSFDSNYVEVTGGTASLKSVDQSFSGTDFNSGSHVGTYLDSSDSKLKLRTQPDTDSTHVNTILPTMSSNLIGYWRFDGNLNDSSGNQHSGTATVESYEEGKVGTNAYTALADNSTDDLITVSSSALLGESSKLSISFWFKSSGSQDDYGALLLKSAGNANSQGWQLQRFTSTNLCLRTDTNPSLGGTSGDQDCGSANVFTGEYVHIVVILNNGIKQTYVNGELDIDGTYLVGGGFGDSSEPLRILNYASNREISGSIDELAMWNEVLSSSDIQNLYESQNANFTELSSSWTPHWNSIVGYWKMDGNWQDSSGNENHGSPMASPEFTIGSKVGSQSGFFISGEADFIDVPHASSMDSTELTVMSWAKSNAFGAYRHILGKTTAGSLTDGYGLGYFTNSDEINFWINQWNAAGVVTADFPEDRWFHVVGTYDGSTIRLYVDGVLKDSVSYSTPINHSSADFNIAGIVDSYWWNGELDDSSIWSTALSPSQIRTIYDRQKQKYSGHYDSPIIDLGSAGNWTNLDTVTSLPFGKEIVAQGSESSSDYSDLSGDLNNGLIGLWTFNETATGTAPSGTDFEDLSGNGSHATGFNAPTLGVQAKLGRGVQLNQAANEYVRILAPSGQTALDATSDFSTSIWFYYDPSYDVSGNSRHQFMFIGTSGGGYLLDFQAMDGVSGASGQIRATLYDGSASAGPVTANGGLTEARFYHLVATRSGSNVEIYIDGVASSTSSGDISSVDFSGQTVSLIYFGLNSHNTIDEAAFWSRALTPTEVQQLYRRGANRIKYQVKSCVDSSCNCKAYNTSPVGSASDCDGDGTPNSSDTDDIYMAEFIGPGGDGSTQYSELFNRAPADLTFNCTANTSDSDNDICVDDEITLEGDTNATSPSFTFSDMATSAVPANNRYFQYRVLMEAEDNTACSGEPCLPELTSVEVGPTGRYYGGSPVISSNSPLSFDNIQSMSFTEGGSCSATYQLSPDGSTYYYFDGTNWVTAGSETVGLSSSSSQITSNISSFTGTAGAGNLYFKAFLNSDTSQACTIDSISLTKEVD